MDLPLRSHQVQTCNGMICLFVCLFGVFRPTRDFFIHLETIS